VVAGGVLSAVFSKRALFEMVNSRYNGIVDTLMYYITMMGQAEVIVPVLAALMLLRAYRTIWYFVTALACNLIPVVIEQGLKSWYDLPRPMNFYHSATWIHMSKDWPVLLYRSFPSGHSEGAFSFFCFLALLLPAKHRVWGVVFFFLGLSVCYSRLYLAAHFFEDVYVGSIIGGVTSTLVFSVMDHYKGLFFKQKNT